MEEVLRGADGGEQEAAEGAARAQVSQAHNGAVLHAVSHPGLGGAGHAHHLPFLRAVRPRRRGFLGSGFNKTKGNSLDLQFLHHQYSTSFRSSLLGKTINI